MGALYARRLRREAGAKPVVTSQHAYTEQQVEAAVASCGLSIQSRSGNDLLCFCPFHFNNDTPSFSISLVNGAWLCFNPACNQRGSLKRLLLQLGDVAEDEIQLMLQEVEIPDIVPLELDDHTYTYPEDVMRRHVKALPGSLGATYLAGRGFPTELCQAHELGYDDTKDSISMAVRRYDGALAGEVFRRRTTKEYKNSWGFEKTQNLWNIHQAKRKPDIVVCEGTLDSLACIRAGFNAVSFLGGAADGVSAEQANLLNIYFTRLYVFTDNDPAGKRFGNGLAEHFAREVLFVPYVGVGPDKTDPGGLTDEEIKRCMAHAKTEFEVMTSQL